MGLGVVAQGLVIWLRSTGFIGAGHAVGLVSLILLIWGCATHLRAKGYPVWLGVIGITGLLGVGAATLLPDKSSYS